MPGLVNDRRLKIDEDSSWDMFAGPRFREESLERVVTECFVRRHMSVRLDACKKIFN